MVNISWKPSFVPNNTAVDPSSISSDALMMCFGAINGTCSNLTHAVIYPGQSITRFIYLMGFRYGLVSETVLASVSGSVTAMNDAERAQIIDLLGTNVSYTVLPSRAGSAKIILQPEKAGCTHNSSPVFGTIEIDFLDCPFGFITSKMGSETLACKCYSDPVISHCDIESPAIVKRMYSWLGMFELNNHSYLATNDYCPLDYCKSSFLNIKSNAHNLSQDEQCQYNRTGVLCGSCPEGWSLVLGSSECRSKCSDWWLLLILPFALAGLLLVATIHFLNLTVTMGTVCGLIFYANILQDYSIALLSTHPIPGLTPILQVFLSWLNLDLGISTCFYDGMEALAKRCFSSSSQFTSGSYQPLSSFSAIATSNLQDLSEKIL